MPKTLKSIKEILLRYKNDTEYKLNIERHLREALIYIKQNINKLKKEEVYNILELTKEIRKETSKHVLVRRYRNKISYIFFSISVVALAYALYNFYS